MVDGKIKKIPLKQIQWDLDIKNGRSSSPGSFFHSRGHFFGRVAEAVAFGAHYATGWLGGPIGYLFRFTSSMLKLSIESLLFFLFWPCSIRPFIRTLFPLRHRIWASFLRYSQLFLACWPQSSKSLPISVLLDSVFHFDPYMLRYWFARLIFANTLSPSKYFTSGSATKITYKDYFIYSCQMIYYYFWFKITWWRY